MKISNPNSAEVNSIMSLHNNGKYEDAYNVCWNLFGKYPNSPLLYNIFGVINVEKNEFVKAISSYLYAIKFKPNYAQAFNNLAILLKKIGETNTAIISYIKAINLKPNYIHPYNNIGIIYFEKGEIQKSKVYFNKALSLDIDNEISNFNLGNIFYQQKKFAKAELYFKKAITKNPKYTEAYYNLGILYHDQEKLNLAKECYEKTLTLDPTFLEAEHILNSIMGNTTKSAPKQYVEKLFDNYSIQFEKSLVQDLHYQTPKIIKKILLKNNNLDRSSFLDLGCGTGLMALELMPHINYMDGVDLSKSMLEQAHNKKCYKSLFHNDIEEFLSNQILQYDYFIAADVFVYIGDLTNIFKLIKNRNKKKGEFIFTTEHKVGKGYCLKKTGRYSHSTEYIEILSKKFGYKILDFRKSNLRKEKSQFITGGIYHLKF